MEKLVHFEKLVSVKVREGSVKVSVKGKVTC